MLGLHGPNGHYVGPHSWSPRVLEYPCTLSPKPILEAIEGFPESPKLEGFQPTHANLKVAKSSPARAHTGADRRYPELGPETQHWLRVHVREKSCSGPGPKSRRSGHSTQKKIDHPKKSGRGGGARGHGATPNLLFCLHLFPILLFPSIWGSSVARPAYLLWHCPPLAPGDNRVRDALLL